MIASFFYGIMQGITPLTLPGEPDNLLQRDCRTFSEVILQGPCQIPGFVNQLISLNISRQRDLFAGKDARLLDIMLKMSNLF
jgi:hypothetical protein